MDCVACGSGAVTQRREPTARGYRRFRCRDCGKQYNERSGGVLNHTQYPSDVIALVVLWRLRCRLILRDLAEMFLIRGIVFSYEACWCRDRRIERRRVGSGGGEPSFEGGPPCRSRPTPTAGIGFRGSDTG